jgi:3-oxoacyl-[acyl-carrier protein] reductase
MDYKIKNKVAIIGGSSRGLGKACAISLAKEGVNIVLCAKNEASLKVTAKEIETYNVKVLPIVSDMSSAEDNKRIVRETIKQFGRIDILVNNSGGPKAGSIKDLDLQDWDVAYNGVLKYTIRMIKMVLPYMEKNGWGRIINITSLAVKEPAPTLILSNVFRSGVVSLAKSISKELIKEGITINNICPGAFKTDRAIQLLSKAAEDRGISFNEMEKIAVESLPQGRYQKPEELGDLVAFLASENASSTTGTTTQIDGGISNSLL